MPSPKSIPHGRDVGALWFGGTDVDRIVLNEQTLWSGSPQDANRPDAWKALDTTKYQDVMP